MQQYKFLLNLFFDKNSKNQKDYFEVIIQNVNQCEKCSTDSPLKIIESFFFFKFIKMLGPRQLFKEFDTYYRHLIQNPKFNYS